MAEEYNLKNDAAKIIRESISSALPGRNVRELLFQADVGQGKLVVIAVGKAGYKMAEAAYDVLRDRITEGLVVTKEGCETGELPGFRIIIAGHPYPNQASFDAADAAIEMVKDLSAKDHVLFLLSGGASSLFEKPMISEESYHFINDKLLASGANINEINTIRKHLSFVKGGRFAKICEPAIVNTIVLSDVIGNDISMVGSGPTVQDRSTGEEAFAIIEKYHIRVPADVIQVLVQETPKTLRNVTLEVIGDIHLLISKAKQCAEMLGYQAVVLTDSLDCEAKEAGRFLASIARTFSPLKESIAFIAGGETTVHIQGNGLGGRNQEMALSCARGIAGLENVLFFSVGSDGSDGPTDAAGGIVDGHTAERIRKCGMDPYKMLENNDSYNALKAAGALVMTGGTGTNVNDLSVLLIRP
ncbi:MAG: glycerate kinase [Lachnospiraceae bacterium]|nr:glycerate kinase [Lachnospiraceae bacterium]